MIYYGKKTSVNLSKSKSKNLLSFQVQLFKYLFTLCSLMQGYRLDCYIHLSDIHEPKQFHKPFNILLGSCPTVFWIWLSGSDCPCLAPRIAWGQQRRQLCTVGGTWPHARGMRTYAKHTPKRSVPFTHCVRGRAFGEKLISWGLDAAVWSLLKTTHANGSWWVCWH